MPNHVWESGPPWPAEELSRPAFPLPAGACDAHMHVFGPAEVYRAAEAARYTLPPASMAAYRETASVLQLQRAVIVQPSYYGSDNRLLLDALAAEGEHLRGVVILPAGVHLSLLKAWHVRGVRGMRLDLFAALKEGRDTERIRSDLCRAGDTAATLGWSVDLYVPGRLLSQLARSLESFPCPVSIAHMGYMAPLDEVSDTQCDELLEVIQRAPVWPKLSGFYRYAPEGPGRLRARRLAGKLVECVPDRVLWGSDWPNVMAPAQDAGAFLDECMGLCSNPENVRRLLVDNPARLYGF